MLNTREGGGEGRQSGRHGPGVGRVGDDTLKGGEDLNYVCGVEWPTNRTAIPTTSTTYYD